MATSPEILSKLNIGSGLNNSDIINSIVAAETAPMQEAIDRDKVKFENQISSYAVLKNDLSTFRTAVNTLAGSNPSSHVGSSSTATVATFTTTGTTDNEDIESSLVVSTLAKAHSLVGSAQSSTGAVVGAGALTIDFGTWSTTSSANDTFTANSAKSAITVTTTSTTTLSQLRDAINNATDDANATIVYDGSNYKLVIKAESGSSSALRITPSDASSSALTNEYSYTTSTKNLTQSVVGVDAAFTIDGISMTRTNNTITDLYKGYTLNLLTTSSDAITISGTQNLSTIEGLTQDYVDAYNTLYTNIQALSSTGFSTSESSAALAGDSLVNRIKRELRGYSNTNVTGYEDGPYSLALLGVMTNRDGTLFFRKTTFKKTFETQANVVNAIFKDSLSTDNSSVEVSKLGTNTVPGSYALSKSGGNYVLNGDSTLAASGTSYTSSTGNTNGMVLTISDSNVTSANVYYGECLLSKVDASLAQLLKFNGDIATRVANLRLNYTDVTDRQIALEERIDKITERYSRQYANMEAAVAGLKDTGDYLNEMLKGKD